MCHVRSQFSLNGTSEETRRLLASKNWNWQLLPLRQVVGDLDLLISEGAVRLAVARQLEGHCQRWGQTLFRCGLRRNK